MIRKDIRREIILMSIKDLLGKLIGGGASKVGDAGLNSILQGL